MLVPDSELLEAQSGETQAEDFREFQLVLDPEFLKSVWQLFSSHQPGRVIGARQSSPESPQNSESVQDYPNPCKIGGHLKPATKNGFARASRAKSVGEN